MMPTATLAVGTTEGRDGDERDGRDSAKSSKGSRSSSVPARERKTFATPKPPSGGAAGAVDEESFISSFEDCKKETIFSGRGLDEELTSQLKALEYPFESCVKDLRSQVVRECCITL